jgi:hypothetical protein
MTALGKSVEPEPDGTNRAAPPPDTEDVVGVEERARRRFGSSHSAPPDAKPERATGHGAGGVGDRGRGEKSPFTRALTNGYGYRASEI